MGPLSVSAIPYSHNVMSYTAASATATLTVDGFSTVNDVATAIADYLISHKDEIPDGLVDLEHDDMVTTLEAYFSLDGNTLAITYGTEYDGNYNSEVFDFLTTHFVKLMTSPYMEVIWMCDDSRDGMSAGTDYYDKDCNAIDLKAALAAYVSRPALIIDAQSGTILNATHCYAIPEDAAQDDTLDEMSDSEVGDWAREHGVPVVE